MSCHGVWWLTTLMFSERVDPSTSSQFRATEPSSPCEARFRTAFNCSSIECIERRTPKAKRTAHRLHVSVEWFSAGCRVTVTVYIPGSCNRTARRTAVASTVDARFSLSTRARPRNFADAGSRVQPSHLIALMVRGCNCATTWSTSPRSSARHSAVPSNEHMRLPSSHSLMPLKSAQITHN